MRIVHNVVILFSCSNWLFKSNRRQKKKLKKGVELCSVRCGVCFFFINVNICKCILCGLPYAYFICYDYAEILLIKAKMRFWMSTAHSAHWQWRMKCGRNEKTASLIVCCIGVSVIGCGAVFVSAEGLCKQLKCISFYPK